MNENPQTADKVRLYGGESLPERRARRRHQFLDAGLQVFGSTGYRTATVRQLCKQAELTDRYFYESFDTLEDLLMAVYQREFDHLQNAVLAAMTTTAQAAEATGSAARQDLMQVLQAGLQALFKMASDPQVARVCWLEVLGVSPRVDVMYNNTCSQFAELISQFARQHIQPWPLKPDETRMVGVALVGAVSQSITHWLIGGHKERISTLVTVATLVFRGCLSGLLAEAAAASKQRKA